MTKPFFVCVNRLIERVKEKSLGPRRHGNGELRCDVIVSRLIDRINTANHCCYRQHTHTHTPTGAKVARGTDRSRDVCASISTSVNRSVESMPRQRPSTTINRVATESPQGGSTAVSSGPLSDGSNLNVGDQVGCQISGHLDGAFSTKLVDVRVRQNALAALHHRSSQGSAQDFFFSPKFPSVCATISVTWYAVDPGKE